jgi:TonB family protein
MADSWVRPPSPGPPDSGVSSRPEDEKQPSLEKAPSSDDYLLIDRLREDAAAGRMDLSSILSEATHAARYFTDATGAALALWSQGVVICRARSGDTAPPLGAKLDVDSGISGECLRTGRAQRCNDTLTDPRVDSEVCQEMGIRSLAAVPLRGGQGVIGILETFSDRPNAFSDAHITLLKKLAKIAAAGREKSVVPSPASPLAAKTITTEVPRSLSLDLGDSKWLAWLPARMRGEEGQPWRLAAAAALLLLLAVGGWMLSRSRSGNARSGQGLHAANSRAVSSALAASNSPDALKNTPSEKNESTITLSGAPMKPSANLGARDVVQKASSSVITARNQPLRPAGGSSAEPAPAPEASADVAPPDPSEAISGLTGGVAPVPQSIANPHPIFPFVAVPVSQGVTGGRLMRKVDPLYPPAARLQGLEGAVIVDALVGEDGSVREVKVTSGPALLADAAARAVKQWRYEPFQLNGKSVSIHNQITIQFKLP